MKVCILRDYKEENWHSMEVYADNLVKYLKQSHKDVEVTEFVSLPSLSRLFPVKYKYIRQFFRYVINPIGVFFQKADVYHITDHANAHLLMVLDPKKTIVTCHDLTAPYWMEQHVRLGVKKRIRHFVEKWRLRFLKRAAEIIAVSESTKHDLITILGIPESHIEVIYEGIDPMFKRIAKKTEIKLPKKFLLNVGSTYTNKNMEGLIRIFSLYAKLDPDMWLVKAGDPWTNDQLRLISEFEYSSRIVHIGFVKQEDLPLIYSQATALLQPSLAEGFGFTPLEAMACGCPVIVSDIPAHREIVQKAGLYISLQDYEVDAKKIHSFLHNRTLVGQYRDNGTIRSKKYTWQKTAQETHELYYQIRNVV